MKYYYPEIDRVFDTDAAGVNTLVIENPALLFRLLTDLSAQLRGCAGRGVVSSQNQPLPTEKHAELLDSFIPFDLNQKALLSKALVRLEKTAVSGDWYPRTLDLLSQTAGYLGDLAFSLPGDAHFSKVEIGALIRAMGLTFRSADGSLCEQLLDYMELVTELDRPKLFFTLNLRGFLSDREAGLFLDTVLSHGYNMIMIETVEYPRLPNEIRYIVDRDLCEISP